MLTTPQRKILTPILLFILFTLFAFVPARSGTTGKIAGKISAAESGEPLIGVNVVIIGTLLGASSGVDGTYFIINIPPGSYKLKASGVGFAPVEVDNVKVFADQTTKIDVSLRSEAVQVTGIEVIATRPIVQRDLTSTTSTMTSEQISKLPVEDVGTLVNLQAGVVEGHFRGGRSNEVKYLVDGISVNDAFSGTSSLQPEVNSIQEIQVLSGTFNAEYGEALSGVVNQVTKIAGDSYTGGVTAYGGDYVSSRNDVFNHIGYLSPFGRSQNHEKAADVYNVEGNFSGPVVSGSNLLKFYLGGRYFYDQGPIFGQRIFNPGDSSWATADNPPVWHVVGTGDGSFVPMNYNERYTLQGKLSVGEGIAKGLSLQGLYQVHNYRDYNHAFQLNPDGDYSRHQISFLGNASYNHMISAAAFLDASLSLFESDYKQFVYEDTTDALGFIHPNRQYVNADLLDQLGPNTFLTGGTQNWPFFHHANTYTAKLDLTDQVDRLHQIKTGIEAKYNTLRYLDYKILVDASTDYKPALPPEGSFAFNRYTNHPYQLSAYLQDKIELDYLVVNIGLRYDYFQPDGKALQNPDEIAALDTLSPPYPDQFFTKARGKSQFSPRVGLSYPMTDKGAVHLSYGHFFQIPAYEFLYRNPNFRISDQGNLPDFVGNTIGNADLEPQRTTMYEIGLQQELAPNLGVTATAFYKDIRNLLGVQVHSKLGTVFAEYINRDYGAVKGFTFSVEKRLSEGFGGTVDYTFQIAQGNTSDPSSDYYKYQAGIPINTELVPLDWDRRHSLNLTLTAGNSNSMIGSLISRLGSGLPYTPSFENQRTGLENSDNRPSFFNADLDVIKYLTVSGKPLSIFLKIYNLFDTPNEVNVFTTTGRAGYTLELTREQEPPRGVNTLQEYFTRPDFYSSPRQVILGASVTF